MSLNSDFVAIISLVIVDVVAIIALAIYLGCTYSWEANSKQEEEAQKQVHEMRAALLRKQGANITVDNSAMQEQSHLAREISLRHGDSQQLFDASAIVPNATVMYDMNQNVRKQQLNFMQDTLLNNSSGIIGKGNESQDDDNYRMANDDDGDDDGGEDGFFNMQRPTSWWDCITMIAQQSEERLLSIQNPDGLLYLTYLKQSALLFIVLSVLSATVMTLLYKFPLESDVESLDPQQTWNFSRLDKLTLAAFLDNKTAAWLIILQIFVANHSIIITGVSQKLSPEQAAKKVQRVFDYRFRDEDTKVVSCNTFRKSKDVQKYWRKVKLYRAKVQEYEQESFASGETQLIWIGDKRNCNRRQVDACKYYEEKLSEALKQWEKTKKCYEEENQGIVILVLKTKACVEQVYDELVKMLGSQRLSQQKNEYFREIEFHKWNVHPGIPSEDIIWQNIGLLRQESTFTRVKEFLKTVLISSIAIFSIIFMESLSLHFIPELSPVILYVTTTLSVIFCFYTTPYLVFHSVQREQYAQKSLRDKAYMRRLLVIEILNVFVIPVLYDIMLVFYMPEDYRQRNEFIQGPELDATTEFFVNIIAHTEELLLRFILQAIMVLIFFQWRSDPRTIVKTFLSSLMLTGRNKFKHYLYDLGLRNVIAVTMFTLGLCCSVLIPVAMPFCAIVFYLSYAFDKYNLFFVYPIDFESQMMNRKILIKCTLSAILMFQAITITILGTLIEQTQTVYLFTVLIIQLLVCVLIFEFIRSPWKGARLTIEEAEEEMKHRLFEDDDIGAYDFGAESQMGGDTTLIGLKKQEVVTADEKATALKTNYEDPFVDTLKNLQNQQIVESKEQDGPQVYEAPALSNTATSPQFLAGQTSEQKDWLTTPLQSIPEREPFQNQDSPRTCDP